MKKLISLAIVGVMLLVPAVALASDITGAKWYSIITVSNNNTEADDVFTTFSLLTQNLIGSNFLSANLTDCAIHDTTGADTAFMPAVNATYPWCLYVNYIGEDAFKNYLLYTGGNADMDGKIRYFPDTGGMTALDDATLELSDNFTIELSGWVDTNNGTDKNLVYKEGAFRTYVSETVSENITAEISTFDMLLDDDFDTDDWTDVGAKIVVDAAIDERLEYDSTREAVDNRCYIDMTSVSATDWDLFFTLHPTDHPVDNANRFYFGLFSAAENPSGAAGDFIGIRLVTGNLRLAYLDGGAETTSGNIAFVYGITYYVTLERNTNILGTINVYSDAARTTHIAGSPKTLAIPVAVADLRYLQASNYDSVLAPIGQERGWIDDVLLQDLATVGVRVTALDVESGEHTVRVTYLPNLLDNGNFEVGDPPDDWTLAGAGASVSRVGSPIKIDSYSANLTYGAGDCHIGQCPSHLAWLGRELTLGSWVYATVADRANLRLISYSPTGNEYNTTTFHTGDGTWQWLTITATMKNDMTSLKATCEVNNGATSGFFDGIILVEGDSIPDFNTFRIFIDNVEEDQVYTEVAVPDNGNGWTFIQNNVMPYMEYLKIWKSEIE